MWDIEIEIEDLCRKNNVSYFFANFDKVINVYNHKLYPIIVKGILNDETTKIIIKNRNTEMIENYDFLIYPNKYLYLKADFIKAIHKQLNKMMS